MGTGFFYSNEAVEKKTILEPQNGQKNKNLILMCIL